MTHCPICGLEMIDGKCDFDTCDVEAVFTLNFARGEPDPVCRFVDLTPRVQALAAHVAHDAREKALEDAAKVCDFYAEMSDLGSIIEPRVIADAIRVLAKPEENVKG